MTSIKRQSIVDRTIQLLGLKHPAQPESRIDALDASGKTYHIKYRTNEQGNSFDFLPDELDAPFDQFLGVFVQEDGTIRKVIEVRRGDLYHLVRKTEDSLRLRWNEQSQQDARIKLRFTLPT
jgi:hypothetical protein